MLTHKRMLLLSPNRSLLKAALMGLVIVIVGLPGCSTNTSSPPLPTVTTPASNSQPVIKAGGSSSTTDFLQILKVAYKATNSHKEMSLLEPSQSENIIAGIKQGFVNIGAISRSLKSAENDGTLAFRSVVQDALLVAIHPSVTGVKNLTTADLKAIYSGSVTNWKQLGGVDAPIVVLDRPEDESAKRLLRKHYLGKDLQNAPKAVVLRKEGELIQTIQSTPYSIGAFSLAYAIFHHLPVTRLSLNGIEPTVDNLKTGKYPMVRTIDIVWRKDASETTQSLISFIFSPAAITALEQAGFVSVTQAADSKSK
jgi:phosphate transport system substrate-binding protein